MEKSITTFLADFTSLLDVAFTQVMPIKTVKAESLSTNNLHLIVITELTEGWTEGDIM